MVNGSQISINNGNYLRLRPNRIRTQKTTLKPPACPRASITWSPLWGGTQQYTFCIRIYLWPIKRPCSTTTPSTSDHNWSDIKWTSLIGVIANDVTHHVFCNSFFDNWWLGQLLAKWGYLVLIGSDLFLICLTYLPSQTLQGILQVSVIWAEK